MKICTKKLCQNKQFCRKLCRKHYRQLPEIKKKELEYREKYLRSKGHKKRVKNWNSSEKGKYAVNKYQKTIKGRFNYSKQKAKRTKHSFLISLEEYTKLLSQNCTYCNSSLNGEYGIGLDRIDNSIGYEFKNVLPCCSECNKLRGNRLTVDETKKVIKYIQRLRKIKNIWR